MAKDAVTLKRPDGARGPSEDTRPTVVQLGPESPALIGDTVSNCQQRLGSFLMGDGEGLELGKRLF